MSYFKCCKCHRWYDTEEFDDVVDYMFCPTCSSEQVPDQMVEISASSDDTPEIIREDDNLQPEYVELDEGIDNDYIEGELSLNDDLEGEGYDDHLF